MIIYHFWFYLKIKKVYIDLIDEPLNKLLIEYKKTRRLFITKIFIFWILGCLLLIVDLIILVFTFRIQWGKEIENNFAKKKIKIENSQNTDINNNDSNNNIEQIDNNRNENEAKQINFEEIKDDSNKYICGKGYTNTSNQIDNKESKSIEVRENISANSNDIKLDFFCMELSSKTYELKVKKDENFGEVIKKLK